MSPKARMILDKLAGVVDNTVSEINELQMGYRHVKQPFTEANARTRLYKQGALSAKLKTQLFEASKNPEFRKRFGATVPAMHSAAAISTTVPETLANLSKNVPVAQTAVKNSLLKNVKVKDDMFASIKTGAYTNKERTVSSLAGGATAASAVALASKLKRMRTNPLVAMGAVALGATLGATTPVSFHTVRHRKKHAGYKPVSGMKRVGSMFMEPGIAEQVKKVTAAPSINQLGKL
jgi:hypothetical protein